MEIESSIGSRLPCLKKKQKSTIRIEYPNHKKSFADNFNKVLAGEMNMFYNVEESDDKDHGNELTPEKIEKIVQGRLDSFEKKMMQELKASHADIIEKLGEMVS